MQAGSSGVLGPELPVSVQPASNLDSATVSFNHCTPTLLILVAMVIMCREKRQKLSQDVPADSSPPFRGPRWRLGKENVGDFYSGSQIPIHFRRNGSIVIRDAPRSPSPAASESDDGGNEDEPGSEGCTRHGLLILILNAQE